jgi:hypothetical protein
MDLNIRPLLSLNATTRADGRGDNVLHPLAAAPREPLSDDARTTRVALMEFCASTQVSAIARKSMARVKIGCWTVGTLQSTGCRTAAIPYMHNASSKNCAFTPARPPIGAVPFRPTESACHGVMTNPTDAEYFDQSGYISSVTEALSGSVLRSNLLYKSM